MRDEQIEIEILAMAHELGRDQKGFVHTLIGMTNTLVVPRVPHLVRDDAWVFASANGITRLTPVNIALCSPSTEGSEVISQSTPKSARPSASFWMSFQVVWNLKGTLLPCEGEYELRLTVGKAKAARRIRVMVRVK